MCDFATSNAERLLVQRPCELAPIKVDDRTLHLALLVHESIAGRNEYRNFNQRCLSLSRSAFRDARMSDDTLKTKRRLSTLASSLADLETDLAALLSQSLPERVLGLDTIQQAKLQIVIPYIVYDLVFGP